MTSEHLHCEKNEDVEVENLMFEVFGYDYDDDPYDYYGYSDGHMSRNEIDRNNNENDAARNENEIASGTVVQEPNPNIPSAETSGITDDHTENSSSVVQEPNIPSAENSGITDDDKENYSYSDQPSNLSIRHLKRSRFRNEKNWKQNLRHTNRMQGKEYNDRKGNYRPAKSPRIMENCRCRFNCGTVIPQEKQVQLFEDFYSLGDTSRQKGFLSQYIVEKPILRERKRKNNEKKARAVARYYYLPDDNNNTRRVCLKMFCFIFQVSSKYVLSIVKNRTSTNAYIKTNHGNVGKEPKNAISSPRRRFVVQHIRSFPSVESHYCRKDSTRLYLEPGLNKSKMYRFYLDYAKEKDEIPVSFPVYKNIFKKIEPPLAFHKPKKDWCTKCSIFEDSDQTDNSLTEEYNAHKQREKDSLAMKSLDMNSEAENTLTLTFDLQGTIYLPQCNEGALFYKRKFGVFNFTIFDSKGKGFCYIFDESNGHKGCSEISTCLLRHLQNEVPETVHEINTWSDTCAAQNRNHYLIAMMIYAVNNIPHLQTINMKYLESGHSYLECDSMHGSIERVKKGRKLYTTSEVRLVVEEARLKPERYRAQELAFSEFIDVKTLASAFMQNFEKQDDGQSVDWLRMKWIRIMKNSDRVYFKYDYSADEFKSFNFMKKPTKRKSKFSIPKMPLENIGKLPLNQLYFQRIPISTKKKEDLMKLVKEGVIRPCHEAFYSQLPHSSKVKDYNEDENLEQYSNITYLDIDLDW